MDSSQGAVCPCRQGALHRLHPCAGVTDYAFCAEADFDLLDVSLREGQELVWVTEDDVNHTAFAFGYTAILAAFFQALRDGAAWSRVIQNP